MFHHLIINRAYFWWLRCKFSTRTIHKYFIHPIERHLIKTSSMISNMSRKDGGFPLKSKAETFHPFLTLFTTDAHIAFKSPS